MAPRERWLPIPGHEGHYEVSDHGSVRSLDRVIVDKNGLKKNLTGRTLKSIKQKSGYLAVSLPNGGSSRIWRVHQLVALSFIGTPPDGMETCHSNDVRTDNRAENLRYDTHSANARDHVRSGNHYETKRTHCPRRHVLTLPNIPRKKWEEKRQRCCLACSYASKQIYKRPELRPYFDEIADSAYRRIMAKPKGY
jgi:hypothetical protein